MSIPLDPKQIVSLEELLMSQVVQQEALTRLLVQKGIFTKEESLEMVRVVDRKMKKKEGEDISYYFRGIRKRGCIKNVVPEEVLKEIFQRKLRKRDLTSRTREEV